MKYFVYILMLILNMSSCNSTKSKMRNSELIKVRLINPESYELVDTLVNYQFIEENLFVLDSFNYPKLEIKNISEKVVLHKNDSIAVKYSICSFDSNKHNIEYYEGVFIKTIDGFKCYGNDGNLPKFYIDNIQISRKDFVISLPKDSIRNLFSPELNQADTYITKDNDIIIWLKNGDGAAAYYVILFVNRKGELEKKITGLPF